MRGFHIVTAAVLGLFLSGCAPTRSATSAPAIASPSGLLVRLSVAEEGKIYMNWPERAALHVVFENTSTHPLGIIDEWNSMGWFNLKFKYTMSDGIPRVMERIDGAWTRNNLTVTQLQPGEVLVRDIYFDHDGWEGVPTVSQNTPIAIHAVFTQSGAVLPGLKPGSEQVEEARRAGAWIGIVESAPVRATLCVRR